MAVLELALQTRLALVFFLFCFSSFFSFPSLPSFLPFFLFFLWWWVVFLFCFVNKVLVFLDSYADTKRLLAISLPSASPPQRQHRVHTHMYRGLHYQFPPRAKVWTPTLISVVLSSECNCFIQGKRRLKALGLWPLSCPPLLPQQAVSEQGRHWHHSHQPVHRRDGPACPGRPPEVHPSCPGDPVQGASVRRSQRLHPTQGQGHVHS